MYEVLFAVELDRWSQLPLASQRVHNSCGRAWLAFNFLVGAGLDPPGEDLQACDERDGYAEEGEEEVVAEHHCKRDEDRQGSQDGDTEKRHQAWITLTRHRESSFDLLEALATCRAPLFAGRLRRGACGLG